MASNQNNLIKKMRQEYPQYNDIDDATFAKAYRQKHYSDLDEDVFMDKVGLHQDTFTEKASKVIRDTLEPILPSSTPPSAAQQHKNDTTTTPIIQKSMIDDVGEFFSSTPPSAAEQHRAKPEQADYVNPEAQDWELGKRLVNRTNELTANAIQGSYEFLGNLKTPLNYLGLETQAEKDMNKRRSDWFDNAASNLSDFVYTNNKLDVKPTHTWDEVKKGFNVGGVFDKDAWQELGNYVLGEGVVSVPDMAEMVATLPMYYASRQQESAEKRAANQGREKPIAEDYALSAPTTIGSIMLDRFGLKGMTEDVVESVGKQALDGSLKDVTTTIAKEIKNGTIKEGATEAVQNPLEMFGEEVGTKKGLSTTAEYLDTALAGAVAGGGMGAGLSGTVATGTEIFNSYTQDKRDAQREAFIQDQYNKQMMGTGTEIQVQQAPIYQFTQELDTKIKTIQDQFTNLVINHPTHPIPIEAVDNIDIAEQVVKDAIDNGLNVTDNDGMNAIDKGFKELEAQIGTIEPIANMVQEPIEQPQPIIENPIIENPIIGQPEPEAVVQDSLTTVATDTDVGHKRLQELEAIPDDELTVEQQWELEDLRKAGETDVENNSTFEQYVKLISDTYGLKDNWVNQYSIDNLRSLAKLSLVPDDVVDTLKDSRELLITAIAGQINKDGEGENFTGESNVGENINSNSNGDIITDSVIGSSGATSESGTAVQETGVGGEAKQEVMFKQSKDKRAVRGELFDLPFGRKGVIVYGNNGKSTRLYDYETGNNLSSYSDNTSWNIEGAKAQAARRVEGIGETKLNGFIDKLRADGAIPNPEIVYAKDKNTSPSNSITKESFDFNGDPVTISGNPVVLTNDIKAIISRESDGGWVIYDGELGVRIGSGKNRKQAVDKANEYVGGVTREKYDSAIEKMRFEFQKYAIPNNIMEDFWDNKTKEEREAFVAEFPYSNWLLDYEEWNAMDKTAKGALKEYYILHNQKNSDTIIQDQEVSPFNKAQIKRAMKEYPNAGLSENDSVQVAQDKIKKAVENNQGVGNVRQTNSTQRDTQQSVPTSPNGASDGQPATLQPSVATGDDRQTGGADSASVPSAASELSNADDGANGEQRVQPKRSERNSGAGVHSPVSLEDDNFTIEDDLSEGGLKTKFKNNIEAIKIVKLIQDQGYTPTPSDKKTLSKYVGWGGLSAAFERPDGSVAKGWEKEAKELKATLSPEAYAEARRSTQDAHYTSKEIVDAIWSGVKQLGFKGGKVLEPSVGVGNFFGMMPSSYKSVTKLYGVELDSTTATIAKALYPKATIQNKGFQDVELSNGTFSLVIGNPPFGGQKLFDPKSKHLNDFSIHNYFFAKSMDALEEGGVLAMVVSNGLLDVANSSAREYLGAQANLIGAIRLPNNAFSKNANTEVTTDIIFLQKRYQGQASNLDQWSDVGSLNDTPINQYFVNNPSNLLGKWGKYGTMYRGDMPALIPFNEIDQSPAFLLPKAIAALPKNIVTHESVIQSDESTAKFDGDVSKVRVGALFIKDGVIYKREADKDGEVQAEEIDKKLNSKNEDVFYTAKEIEKIKAMIYVVSVADELRRLQIDSASTDGQIKKARQELNRVYDTFTKQHGYLNNAANVKLFEEDIRSPFLRALENNYDKGVSAAVAKSTKQLPKKEISEKSDIFYKRTQTPYERPTSSDNTQDALTISLGEYGAVNFSYMESLTGKSEAEIIAELDGFIYEDVNDGWVTKEEFLSGNVKQKYKEATNEEYKKALLAVFPKDIDAVDISVTLGASWIPKSDMEEFITYISGDAKPSANYAPYNAKWVIRANTTSANTSKWGTNRKSVKDILEATMNLIQIEVKDNIGTSAAPQMVLNSEETAAAQDKQEQLKEEFKEWIWKSSERRERLGALYNEKFNNKVTRTFDGSHLKFIGKSDTIDLRAHQANAVWRTMQGGTVLFDHTVGTGKTYTAIASVMELRRIKKATKPLIVVPNHLTGQWGKEWMELYPNASILVPTERDFEASRRKILMGKIATGDYDGIIIGHSQLSLIENDIDFTYELLNDEVHRIQQSIDMLRVEEGKDARSVKNAEKSMESLKTKIATLNDMRRDDNLNFSQLGIDSLFVDESHEFKNLMYTTGLQGVAGLGNPTGSKKAFDLFIKTQGLLKKTGGNNVVFMTGTPISNTIAEMFTVQRYLSYDKLKADNLDIFDAWVKQYAEIKSDWELTPSGKYKLRTRLSRFNNMPELITEYKQFADVVTREDIPSLPIPRVKGGKPQNLVVERSPAQADYIGIEDENGKYPEKSLVYRSENLPKGKAKKGDDNMLKIMGEARKVALDMRLIDPNAADNPDSKVNVTVKNTIEIYNRWNDKRGTQLIFCDLSTPKGAVAKEKARLEELIRKADSGDEKAIQELDDMNPDDLDALNAPFSVYDDIKAKLIAQGIPEREIAFIHDAATKLQKQELFSKVKGGAIRILIGSTSKMGAGMNVQDRLVALHHIDVPWRPSDLEQREGRIIRQGNLFYQQDPKGFEVDIFRYATKNTLDSMMWQTIEAKANFIEQLRAGNLVDREVDDVSGEAMSAAEMKAMSSGNPLILEDMKLSKDIKKLEALKKNHDRNQFDLEKKIKRAEDIIAQSGAVLDAYTSDEVSAQKLPEKFSMHINGKTFDKREDAGAEILSMLDGMAKKEVKEIGSVGDFKIHIEQSGTDLSGAYATITISGKQDYDFDFTIAGHSHEGLAQKVMNIIKRIPTERANYERQLNYDKDQLPQFKEQIEPFKKADELDALRSRKKEIIAQLHKKEEDKKQSSSEVSGKAPISHAMKLVAKKSSMTYDEIVKRLEDNRAPYEEIPYERTEWDRLFPNNSIDTHIGVVEFGENQFNKLDPNTKDPKNHERNKQDRRKHIFYIYEVLKNPAFIIDNGGGAYVFVKEFDKPDASTRRYASIVITKHGNNVVISSHNMKYSQIFKEIEKGNIVYPTGVTPSVTTNPHSTPAIVVDDSIPQITPNTQTKEDNINEHFSRANGYDEAGINYVPPYKVIGLPERSESGEIKIGADSVTLPSLDKPMNADTIRVYLSDIIGNRLYDAKLKGKSNLGIYKESDSSIRVKNYSDVETMAHEMAHFLDFYFKNPKREATGSFFRKEILKNKEEIKTLSYTTNPKQVLSEGFAEFVRLYLTNYNALAGLAPNMLKDFEARLSQDKVLNKKMVQLRDGMHQYYYQGATTQNYQGGELNSIAKKIKRSQAQIGKNARQKVIDRIHSIKRIEADVKGDVDNDAMRSPYKALQLVNGHSSIMYSAMNFGVPTVLENGDISYSGKALNDIFEPATKHGERRIQLLSNYLVARRANELKNQGRENLIPQEAIDNDLKLAEQYPEFVTIAQEYQVFNTAMLDFYVSMNHITASQRESFLEFNKNYVPFHRVIESVQNGGVSAGTIGKRLTGGTHSLGNIMENIIDGLESNIKEAMISRGKSMFYSMLEQSGMGGVYATRVATENKMVQVDLEAQAKKIAEIMAQLGLTISKDGMIVSGSMSAEEIYDIKEIEDNLLLNPEAMEFFTHGHPPTSKEGYIDSAIINGKRIYFETKDAGLIDAMTSFKGQNYGIIMSTLMAVKNIMTWNITNNPLFYLSNFARDTVSAGVLSKNGFVPVLNSVKGMYHFITQSKVYKDFMASGGGYGTMRSGLGGDVHAMEMLRVNRGFDVFNKVINAMAYGADVFEYGTRLGEFELAQKAGKSNWQAAFEGREVSTDFAIKGSNSDITGFMATVPFMKAAINGIDKTARRIFSLNGEMKLSNIGKFRNAHGEMIGHKIKFYAAGGMIVAGTLALFLQNKDDERYRRLTRDQKLMYWNIFVGDNHIKIPRPYDIGFIFSALPEIVADLIYTKHGEDALKDFMFGMKSMFSIGDISGLFQPIMDHMTNTNWMGSPIIPTQVQNVDDKADQYNDNTALLYKKVGKATGVSPILMQHYVDGYLGLTAKMIEETAENMLWDKKQWGERPFAQNPIEFLTYRFRGKEEESRTAWSEKYYDLSKRASAVKASYDAKYKKAYLDGGSDITEYMSDIDKQAYIGVEDAVSNINSDLGDMKNDLEAVIYSKKYTAKQKEEIINGAYKAKREALQTVVTQLETQLDNIEEE